MPVEPATQEAWVGGLRSDTGPMQKHKTLSEITKEKKRTRGEAQVIEQLTSKYKALSSNPSTAKTKTKIKVKLIISK
jgi:hypothetical protein